MGHRSRRRHSRPFTGEPNGLQPGDDVGNRRSAKQQIFPPDDLGNRREPEEHLRLLPDDAGNRVDLPPTHEISGVLAEIDGRRRRKKKGGPLVRVGRYFVGGVNPLVSGQQPPPKPVSMPQEVAERSDPSLSEAANDDTLDEEGGGKKKRRRRKRREGREPIDGNAAQEVSERRAQRFFDFEEDDRFEYVLKSDPALKCKDAEDAVRAVLLHAGRDATVKARLLEDRDRPKVLITIEERGPAASLPEERRSDNAKDPLFVLGNAALMSLNYLVNKIVNRYPDDRIRLAILPQADEPLYLESLAQHLKQQASSQSGVAAHDGGASAAIAAAPPAEAAIAVAPIAEAAIAAAPVAEAAIAAAPVAEAPIAAAGEPATGPALPTEPPVAAATPNDLSAVEAPVEALMEVAGEVAVERAEVEPTKPSRRKAPSRKKTSKKAAAPGEVPLDAPASEPRTPADAPDAADAADAPDAPAAAPEAVVADTPRRATKKAPARAAKKAPAKKARAKTAEETSGSEEG